MLTTGRLARRIALVLTAVLLLTIRVAPAQEAPIVIYAVLPLTGFGAFFGKAIAQSVGAFEASTNRNGGIKGRPLKVIIQDDETNPQVAVQLFDQIIAKGGTIVIGPGFSASCGAVLPLLTNGPLTYCLSPGVHPAAGSYMFAADASTTDLWAAQFRFARERGWTRVATILTNDASGQDIARQLDALAALPEYKSIQLISRQTFNLGDLSVSAQMANIKNAAPNVLLTGATGSPFGTLLRGARDVGLDVPVFASSTNMTPEQMSQYNAYLPHDLLFANPRGVIYETAAPKPIRDAQRTFFDAFRTTGIHPGQGQTIPWDPLSLVVEALKRLGPNATPAQLRDFIGGLDHWTGTMGEYDFKKIPQRGIGLDAVVVYRWDPAKNDYVVLPATNVRR
jgi:branched-chain amino acid transport system substrate-binding protein